MPRRPRLILLALMLATSTTHLAAPTVLARSPVIPRPGETVLTDAERRLTLRTMTPAERRVIGPALEDGAEGLAVSYSRRLYRIVELPGGRSRPELAAPVSQAAPESGLSLPARELASTASKPGTDLYISFTIIRTRSSSPYEWLVLPYAEWRGIDGMNATNSSADTLGVAWAGSATYLHSQRGDGEQWRGWPCNQSDIDIWPSDGTPGAGTAWSFHEWGYWWGCGAWWAEAEIRLRENAWQAKTDNLVFKYFHTYGGLDYSFGFSKSPGVTITPTNEQWALTLFEIYRH